MAAKNNITGDSIISKANTKSYSDNYDLIFSETKTLIDSNGKSWETCSRRCFLEIKDGIAVCDKNGCDKI